MLEGTYIDSGMAFLEILLDRAIFTTHYLQVVEIKYIILIIRISNLIRYRFGHSILNWEA